MCWYGGGWNNGPVTGPTCASNVCIDRNNHYIWFQGTDNRLWVCWYSGGWLNGSVTPANCYAWIHIDWNRHYVWYRGADSKLYVCWWGGSTYLNGSLTAANCAPGSVFYNNFYTSVFPDRNNGYCWYKGTDNKLYVCWYGGGNGILGP